MQIIDKIAYYTLPASDSDFPRILEIASTNRHVLGTFDIGHLVVISKSHDQFLRVALCFDTNEVVGFCSGTHLMESIHVTHLCVDAIHQRKGVGRMLLESIMLPITLTTINSHDCEAYYRHLGFKLVHTNNATGLVIRKWKLEQWRYPIEAK